MPTVRALHQQTFAGRVVEKDETFEASTHETRVLVALNRAVISEKNVVAEEPKATVTKRPYKRRDITAGQIQAK